MRIRAFFALLALSMAYGGCSLFTRAVARTALEEAARLLCVQATAERAGVSAEDIRETACDTREAWLPFLEEAIAAKRAGAIRAGMTSLTPENATPSEIKPVPELEQRK